MFEGLTRTHDTKSLAVASAAMFLATCLAPKAEPVRGDIAGVIERGIELGDATFDHSTWDEILQAYSKEGGKRFDYSGLKREEAKLDTYLDALSNADIEALEKNEILALFSNAYNAYTAKTVLERVSTDGTPQIQSIREISDVFDLEKHNVGGFKLSLNNIEHNILRPFFKDPRIHFAVNCASASCPPMPTSAFTGKQVDEQFETLTRTTLSSPDYIRVEGNRLEVTKLMEWYGSDFVTAGYKGAEKDLASFIRKYTSDEVRRWIEARGSAVPIDFMDYDWTLNEF
jgi:hypothetical protein